MKRLSAVIGANYGDEGKGHIVDYLSNPDSVVVRFNGGAQAGHTVVAQDGRRHVFHHFGSGSVKGAWTYLSRFFLLNPIIFCEEFDALYDDFGIDPCVGAHPDCLVTTPYDMLVNQSLELKRGSLRHGSCGLGIHETLVRSRNPDYALRYRDIVEWPQLRLLTHLARIRDEWVPMRCGVLEMEGVPMVDSEGMLQHFVDDVERMRGLIQRHWSKREYPALGKYQDLIFEGAQGLGLDQNAEGFPCVTPSSTGVDNILTILDENDIGGKLDLYYVTRPYITRHGKGPLLHEAPQPKSVVDTTNKTNPWQGPLRFGWFDVKSVHDRITKDVAKAWNGHRLGHSVLAVTCLDHVLDTITWFDRNGHEQATTPGPMLDDLWHTGRMLLANGPTRQDVRERPHLTPA